MRGVDVTDCVSIFSNCHGFEHVIFRLFYILVCPYDPFIMMMDHEVIFDLYNYSIIILWSWPVTELTFALRTKANQSAATVWVFVAGESPESILHVVCKWNLSHIFRVGSVRFIIQFTPFAYPIKVAAMATSMFDAPRDAVFNQLCRPGLDDVVYKYVILYGVRCCLALTCKSYLGEPGDGQVQKDNLTGELHFCEQKEGEFFNLCYRCKVQPSWWTCLSLAGKTNYGYKYCG